MVEAARRLAEEVLAPAAQATDQAEVVPESHLRALADAGLFGLMAPGADLSVVPEVFEALAGACGVTFFVWAQHHSPVRLLGTSANEQVRERWLPPLLTGEVRAGVAFAHLRRPGPPAVAATRVNGGWRVRGEAPWVTSWGVAGLFAVAARVEGGEVEDGEVEDGEVEDGDRVVWLAVPGEATSCVRPSAPLRLAAMNASRTVRLAFHDLFVADADVIDLLPFATWSAGDRAFTAQPNPAVFGVARTAIRLLSELGDGRAGVAGALAEELLDCRQQSDGADPEDLGTRFELRAWSLELAMRSAYAFLAATGGRGMELSHPAQRLVREAAFYAVQALTPERRQATLTRLARITR